MHVYPTGHAGLSYKQPAGFGGVIPKELKSTFKFSAGPEDIINVFRQAGILSLLSTILVALGWGKGFTALAKYWWNKGNEAAKAGDKALAKKYRLRAIKMCQTALNKALAGEYQKKIGG